MKRTQPTPPTDSAAQLLAEAARDYAKAQAPATQAAARNGLAHARIHGNQQGGAR